ncbi:hypothetical protein [Corynebacterium freiburgense]|uniref:hypothetical protein n=1 Tax=Corynebacterium freiburgense TaxID=556548 RepID=UPI00047BC9D0|nr:hypothetical protein [Corynebacterium freiburgense]WJZ01950.1 hypothetical protein CFREI_03230 [Corynebacterium freiburgense]
MHGEDNTIQLSSATQLHIRPGPAIQFGTDPHHAGIFDALTPTNVKSVALALLTARNPVPLNTITVGLTAAGLTKTAAQSLIQDLLNYRILQPKPPHQTIIILGNNPLARHTTNTLQNSGLTIRQPIPEEHTKDFLDRIQYEKPTPIIAIQQPINIAEHLKHPNQTWIPATITDGQGHIGPLHIKGQGPCPMCYELHQTQQDPHRNKLQPWETPPPPNQILLQTTAARIATCALTLLEQHEEPPGTPPLQLTPGEIQTINPYANHIQRTYIQIHPTCPICWERETSK